MDDVHYAPSPFFLNWRLNCNWLEHLLRSVSDKEAQQLIRSYMASTILSTDKLGGS